MNKSNGFTLIELLIVVTIIGILSAIVMPSYAQYVRQSHRAEATTKMMEAAQAMERCFAESNSYLGDGCPTEDTVYDTVRYQIRLSAITDTGFVVQGVPQGDQTSDYCGTLGLNQTGLGTPRTPSDCWGK